MILEVSWIHGVPLNDHGPINYDGHHSSILKGLCSVTHAILYLVPLLLELLNLLGSEDVPPYCISKLTIFKGWRCDCENTIKNPPHKI